MKSHAANPQAIHLSDDVFRVFFSSRDSSSRSHVAYVDVDINKPDQILELSRKPVLSPGPIGMFDDCGVVPSCIVWTPSGLAMYYIGVSLSVTTSFTSFAGLALLGEELDSAVRFSPAPLLCRTADEPYSNGAAWVCPAVSHPGFDMWFETQFQVGLPGSAESFSVGIKHATSLDGYNWTRSSNFALRPLSEATYFATPCVDRSAAGLSMWYSIKTDGRYSIGGAESTDGRNWQRNDSTLGMLPSGSGWDGDEVSYPNVFSHKGHRYMFYNGNRYGATGFGLAVFED